MMGSDGEGGLGVTMDIVEWHSNVFYDGNAASIFFAVNRDNTDGEIHTVIDVGDNAVMYIVFTRKEEVPDGQNKNS